MSKECNLSFANDTEVIMFLGDGEAKFWGKQISYLQLLILDGVYEFYMPF